MPAEMTDEAESESAAAEGKSHLRTSNYNMQSTVLISPLEKQPDKNISMKTLKFLIHLAQPSACCCSHHQYVLARIFHDLAYLRLSMPVKCLVGLGQQIKC